MATPKQLETGNWQVKFQLHGRQHTITMPTKKEAAAAEREMRSEAARGTFVSPANSRALTGDRLDAWLEAHRRRSSEHGYRVYASTVKNHIRPQFASVPLGAITVPKVQDWVDDLAEARSTATAKRAFGTMRAFLSEQERLGYLGTNPAKKVRPPGHKAKAMTFLEPHELDAVVHELGGDTWQADVVLGLAFIGCRVGDLSRLTEADWDRVNGRLHVVDQKTKTDRNIPVFDELAVVLERCVARGGSRLFMTDGLHGQAVIRSSAFAKRHFKSALKRAGVTRNVRVHDLRHTCASWLIRQGFGPVHVAAYLGHSKPTTTMNTYSHLFADDMADMGSALDQMWKSRHAATPIRGLREVR